MPPTDTRMRRRARLPLALLGALLAGASVATSCRATIDNRDPTGERFPAVAGEGLDGTAWTLPADLAGAPAVLLVAYVQDAQFDADRWLLGLAQVDPGVRILELPTVRGWVPHLLADTIDEGMRSGIPPADRASIVTVYGDADAIAELTGTQNPRNARALLVDAGGTIVWFHDQGYSARVLLAMLDELERIAE